MRQRDEVRDRIETCRDLCKGRIAEARKSVAPTTQEFTGELSRSTIEYVDDVLDSALERYEHFEERVRAIEPSESLLLADYEVYILSDLLRSIEFCEGLAERFARLWDGLQ